MCESSASVRVTGPNDVALAKMALQAARDVAAEARKALGVDTPGAKTMTEFCFNLSKMHVAKENRLREQSGNKE